MGEWELIYFVDFSIGVGFGGGEGSLGGNLMVVEMDFCFNINLWYLSFFNVIFKLFFLLMYFSWGC